MLCYFCSVRSKASICLDCRAQLDPSFQWLPSMPNICMAGYLYSYTPVIQDVIHGLKYHGNFKLGHLIRSALHASLIPDFYFESDGHVCVPSHWFRQLFRGRHHIPFLFDFFKGKQLNLSGSCRRKRYSSASVGLTRKERLNKKSHSFSWSGNSCIQSVTILDDVCTTGATLTEMARMFKAHGVETVYALVIAHQPYELPSQEA